MSDTPLQFCVTCRALVVLVLAGGIALAFDGLGGTLEQKNATSANLAGAEPIMLFEPVEHQPVRYPGPLPGEFGIYGEI